MRRVLAIGWALAALAVPAVADEAALRRELDDLLRFYAPQAAAPVGFSVAEPVRIRREGTVYHLVLPGAAVHLGEARLRLGDLPLLVREQNDDRISFVADLPEVMNVESALGVATGSVRSGERRLTGVYDPRLFAFTALDGRLGAIEVLDSTGPARILLSQLVVTHAAGPLSRTRWTTQTNVKATGLSMAGPGDTLLAIGEIAAANRLAEIDLATYGALARTAGADPLAALPAAGARGRGAAMRDLLARAGIGRYEGEWRVTGLETVAPDGTRIALGELATIGAWRDLDQPLAGLALGVAGKDLRIAGGGATASPYGQFAPRAFILDLDIGKVPLFDLAELAEAAATTPGLAPPADAPDEVDRARKLLGEAGTTIRLKPSRVDAETLSIGVEGGLVADANAAWGGQGVMTFEVKGLQQAIAALRRRSDDREALNAAAFLLLLQGIGRAATPQDRAAGPLRYELALEASGAVTLNGMDLAALAALFAAPRR